MKRKFCLFVTLLLIATFVVSCGSSSGSSGGSSNNNTSQGSSSGSTGSNPTPTSPAANISVTSVPDTLIVAQRGEPVLIDPQNQTEQSTTFACIQMYEPLVSLNVNTGEYVPWLAESWERIDDLTLRFHLRQDVYFHNGEKMTANDVKFTLMRGKASTKKAWLFRPFDAEGSTVIDEYTIDIKTEEPFAAILSFLANNGSLIVSQKAVESADSVDAYGRAPDGGTGPWKFKSWVAGDNVTYDRFDQYWGEKPAFATMILRNITDDNTRALSLESGDIDLCVDVAPSQIGSINASGIAEVHRVPNYVMSYICFNIVSGPLSDVRVRQALRYAMDLDSMVDVAYPGVGTPADGVYPSSITCHTDSPPELTYTYDLDKAKMLMDEAGYADGFSINFWTNENQSRIDMGEMLQNAWAKINVKVNVEVMEFAALLELLDEGKHDSFMMGWVLGGDDGDFIYDLFYSTLGYQQNRAQYKNPRYDELATLGRTTFDPELRQQYYAEIQDILRRDLPMIPVQFGEATYGLRNTLTGVELQPETNTRVAFIRPK